MYKAILFDFDGTIADTIPLAVEAFRRAVIHHRGETLSEPEIRQHFGPAEPGVMLALVPEAPVESMETYFRHYEDLHQHLRSPFTGLAELLGELRTKGVKLGVVTGKSSVSLEISLRYIGLEKAFDALEAGCDDGPCKPEGILRMLKTWNIPTTEALYVGDSVHDVYAAREVGIPVASVSWAEPATYTSLKEAAPDFLFSTVEEFREWALI
jgi:phosphoglycolate phosphatase/pyrophosphatase PpaX